MGKYLPDQVPSNSNRKFQIGYVNSFVGFCFFPSSCEQGYCVEKRLCKFEALGREFVTFLRHYSCKRQLGKQVTHTWKKLWAWYKSRQLKQWKVFLNFSWIAIGLCVDMTKSFSKWLFNRSEEKYFSSHVIGFSMKKKIEVVLTKRSQQIRNNKEN